MEGLSIHYFTPIVSNIIRYFMVAGTAFVIFYKFYPNRFFKNKIQLGLSKNKDFIREILHSVQSSFVIGLVIALFLFTTLRGYTAIYNDFQAYHLLWVPLSLFVALILHDSYFYWMHRIVHHPKLYKRIHLTHHKSTNPSPWTSFSFHFFEAISEAMAVPLILCLIPMHPLLLILFGLLSFSINVYGHLGYEIAPKWFRNSVLFEVLISSTYHNLHHAIPKGNYGLYFRFWDRLLKTENPNYKVNYDRIQKRRFGQL